MMARATRSWRTPFAVGMTFLAAVRASCVLAGPPEAPTGKARLTISSWEGVQRRVADHGGKVVIVSIWTTTCGACVEELPRIVELAERFPAEKLAVMTVACDYDGIREKPPKFYVPKVEKMLNEAKAFRTENLMVDVAFVDFLEKIELRSTPAVYVYGRDGKLLRRFDNEKARTVAEEFTTADVTATVNSALAAE